MKHRVPCILATILVLSGCEGKKDEITVTETRPLTTRDVSPKLSATSDERFRDAKPSPVKGDLPEGWLSVPPTQMRLLNYRFGQSGSGEVWVSMSMGSVLDNVNRWLKQFGAPEVDEAGLAQMPSVAIAGTTGKWTVAEGDYESGMGAPVRPGFGLAGVVAQSGGQILTVKMVGPKDEVQAAMPALEAYAKSLRFAE